MKTKVVDYVCTECGSKHTKRTGMIIATWYEGVCSICGEKKIVTEGRDYWLWELPKDSRIGGVD